MNYFYSPVETPDFGPEEVVAEFEFGTLYGTRLMLRSEFTYDVEVVETELRKLSLLLADCVLVYRDGTVVGEVWT